MAPKGERGSASFNFFVVVFFIGAIVFFWFFLNYGKKPAKPAGLNPKIEKLDGEVNQLYTTMTEAESMHDRRKYMEILSVASPKLVQADEIWEEEIKARRGTFHGMMAGMSENYDAYFSPEEKFEMLSEKYKIPVATLRTLKADIELVFSEQFVEKFTPFDANDVQPGLEPTQDTQVSANDSA
jgi:hypothetical protein